MKKKKYINYVTKKINSTLDIMYKSSNPYLFRLLNHYETQTYVFMIFESYDDDSLDNKIINGKCDLKNSLKYIVEVMLGVQYIHSFHLYNLNFNPENILVNECVKLTDYDLKMEGWNDKLKRDIRYKKRKYKLYNQCIYISRRIKCNIKWKTLYIKR